MSTDSFSAASAQRVKSYRSKYAEYGRSALPKLYDEWAENGFDEDTLRGSRNGQKFVSHVLATAFPNNKGKARILDVGAGTGQLAEQLRDEGFKLIDALDVSQRMLDKAKEKNVYQNFYCYSLEGIDGVIQDDAYDITCGYGIIAPGHFGEHEIYQMLRITRKGGLMCVAGSGETWKEYFKPVRKAVEAMTNSKKAEVVEDCSFPGYFSTAESSESGVLIIMRKV